MSEEQTQNTNPQDSEDIAESTEQVESEPQKSAKRAKATKSPPKTPKRNNPVLKRVGRLYRCVKKVKREETRRKLKRAMLILLVFSLIVTSVVYVMLLFIEENSVRITASSNNREKSISLSVDNEYWTPYLNVGGPKQMWDLSYNKIYDREQIATVQDVAQMLTAEDIQTGIMHGENIYVSPLCSKTPARNLHTFNTQ